MHHIITRWKARDKEDGYEDGYNEKTRSLTDSNSALSNDN